MKNLDLPHGRLPTPAFLPDATRGVVRGVDATDLERCGIRAVVMNVFHLMRRPGSSTVDALGGLHEMSGWKGPIVTDSGGFQAYSVIRQKPGAGSVTDKGIAFRPGGSSRKFNLTPEKSIQLQLRFGADVLICLDDCTHVDDPPEVQKASVERTVAWARRCKEEFLRLLEEKKTRDEERPLLFAVIQGGGSLDLRKRCAGELLDIGFEGYGFGGWPLDGEGNLLLDLLAYTRELVPRVFPLFGLGIGHPTGVAECARIGYDLFDSSLPTRDARRGRLFVVEEDGSGLSEASGCKGFSFLYIQDEKHTKSKFPVSTACDCLCCNDYSLGYLHHLFRIRDPLYVRLATIHNLRFMARLMQRLGNKCWA